MPCFDTSIIVALITRVVLTSLAIGNSLATYTLEAAIFVTVVSDSFLTDRIVGFKGV